MPVCDLVLHLSFAQYKYFFELKGRIIEPNVVIIIDHRAAPGFALI